MIVSWNWLKDYVALSMSADELTERLTLTGLNLEGVSQIGDDTAIDLEVTSNRPDCLGHIGVAREVAVLWESQLKIPDAKPQAKGPGVDGLASVALECPDLCPRYTARVIRGVKVGQSPEWLAGRLRSVGIAVINNVVDISNYVMLECGQPLHAFDFAKLSGHKIIVRRARIGEKFVAINHQTYELNADTCVIADAEKAVALGGVMGGATSEVSDATTDLLIEAADFSQLSVRNTARRLNLHSPSSYRFERGVDPEGIDWASRRCCELILELAGGELADGVIDVGAQSPPREPVKLRFDQLERILGIRIPDERVRQILTALGNDETHVCDHCVKVVPPSWRADLTREIDLVEEVARIHGYEEIPEDAGVKMVASTRSREDRVLDQVRDSMVALGFDEAMTISAVESTWVDPFRPWSSATPLSTSTPVLRGANHLRQSLLPSLLAARRINETLSNNVIELFEIAEVYLPQSSGLPDQRRMLGLSSGGGFLELKGVIETFLDSISPGSKLDATIYDSPLFATGRGAELKLGDRIFGYLGEVSQLACDQFELRSASSVAEIDLSVLIDTAVLVRSAEELSPFPPMGRDMNIVVDEQVAWADVEKIVRAGSGELLETLVFQEEFRSKEKLGPGKKSLLFSIQLRSAKGTLTNEQADEVRDNLVAELGKQLGGQLRA
ncbi:phenylalanine--tRNA ligase subunit beta [Bythopirellula polymerisocia]|uniref:Phenylalanine--tRNA ligase beta subunit n=1 Tax=Bythopirellula polymerisocia TaxID=2528003 RepID=A0A5C6CWI1_9BACT|nr:phenylalanine--tRNA ligase subunit beta [Bythopirellula polymerisocia]TWU28225.1 Phenylalanine--tRNA ligase beta subunit [Bythopirellula polymerisocia]